MSSIVVLCAAQSQVDVDKLFHANPPSLSPNRPINAQKPLSNQNADPSIVGIFDEDFKPFRGSRHDEFDWALTKVYIIKLFFIQYSSINKRKLCFQKVLDDSVQQNTVVSPFLVKLLLSILAEAAGQGTSTHRELLSILPSIRTEEETRDLYGRTFGSLLVSHFLIIFKTKNYK